MGCENQLRLRMGRDPFALTVGSGRKGTARWWRGTRSSHSVAERVVEEKNSVRCMTKAGTRVKARVSESESDVSVGLGRMKKDVEPVKCAFSTTW